MRRVNEQNWTWYTGNIWVEELSFKQRLSRLFNEAVTHVKNKTRQNIIEDPDFSKGLFILPGMALVGLSALSVAAPIAFPLGAVGILSAATGYVAGILVRHRLIRKHARASNQHRFR